MLYTMTSLLSGLFPRFSRGHISSSMNVLASQLPSYATILKKLNRKYHIIVSDDEALGPAVSSLLSIYGLARFQTIMFVDRVLYVLVCW